MFLPLNSHKYIPKPWINTCVCAAGMKTAQTFEGVWSQLVYFIAVYRKILQRRWQAWNCCKFIAVKFQTFQICQILLKKQKKTLFQLGRKLCPVSFGLRNCFHCAYHQIKSLNFACWLNYFNVKTCFSNPAVPDYWTCIIFHTCHNVINRPCKLCTYFPPQRTFTLHANFTDTA